MNGCLDENSPITMADKSIKKLKDIKVGEEVISFNEESKQFEIDEVESHGFTGIKDGFKIEMEDGSFLKPAEDHLFLTNKGWKKASELKEGDDILKY